MSEVDKIVKEIFEMLIKYANLTPDAVDDLYYLQGYIEEKDKEISRLTNIIDELEDYLSRFLYMLNGITDKDIYEQCQLDDFTQVMDKLKELKEGKK